MKEKWINTLPASVTRCDVNGTIIGMNNKSMETFAKSGGKELIGRNLLDCHPGKSRTTLEAMLASGTPNFYTTEKNGKYSLICQIPWFDGDELGGFVEMIYEIPGPLPHYVRE